MEVKEIYKILIEEYEEQGWWPRFINGSFVYEKDNKNKELSSIQRFVISISSILAQNTKWSNVEKAIKNLEKFNFLRKEEIKQLGSKELEQLIKPSGFYKQKAKKLKAFIDFLDSKKEINKENLLSVNGIGKETADSILLYAYNKEVFVIDAYTIRIMNRLGFEFKGYDDLQRMFMENLEKDYRIYNEFHALLVKLGKETCLKNKPKCRECCLRNKCKFKAFS